MADYPPAAFHFAVAFGGTSPPPVPDMAFQEVGGLESEIEVETVIEGGENRFVHTLPKGIKHPNLMLKRGMGTMTSGLVIWCKSVMESGLASGLMGDPIQPKELFISLLDENGLPLAMWLASNAWPVKWQIGGFDAMKNEIAVETIELSYTTLTRTL